VPPAIETYFLVSAAGPPSGLRQALEEDLPASRLRGAVYYMGYRVKSMGGSMVFRLWNGHSPGCRSYEDPSEAMALASTPQRL
jgi:hypothetical protein